MKLYKAVRPDGTDFYTGKLDWIGADNQIDGGVDYVVSHPDVGYDSEVIRWENSLVGVNHDSAATYLSVSDSPSHCTGMLWPCRLLEVRPLGPLMIPDPDGLPHKRAARFFMVEKEIPAWQVFGEHGELVADILEQLASDPDSAIEFSSAFREVYRDQDLVIDFVWEYQVKHDSQHSFTPVTAMRRYIAALCRASGYRWYSEFELIQFVCLLASRGAEDEFAKAALELWSKIKA